ncbi:M23 family metallopeptidase [Tepidanaerobacter acetatoxydans]|uniref:M23 family metallopeptidase n=1 Tax=Tepidanaerobacter acetatoxydans TaxID=499229 RepID=UPI001BD440F0|nr:M23 family metallopeptidase [Tepidanaerobacter acetatoxydans]
MIPGWAAKLGGAVVKGLLNSDDIKNIVKVIVFIVLGIIVFSISLIAAFPVALLHLPLANEGQLGNFYTAVQDCGKDDIEIPWEEVAAVWGALHDQDYSGASRGKIKDLADNWLEEHVEQFTDEDGVTHTEVTYTLRNFDDVMYELNMTEEHQEQAERLLAGLKSGGLYPPAGWAALPQGGWNWPVPMKYSSASHITSPYGYRIDPVTLLPSFHHGVDIGVPEGTMVTAARAGTVKKTGNDSGYGLYVVIESGLYTTRYAHLSRINVSKGTKVKVGDIIARSGNTGRSTGPHLHFEIQCAGQYMNPLNFY